MLDLFGIHIGKKTEPASLGVVSPAKGVEAGKRSKTPAEMMNNQFSLFEGMEPPNTKIWKYIELAALYSPDISSAINTIKALANTPMDTLSEDGEPLSDKAQEIIKAFSGRCFPLAGGIDGLQLALIVMFAKMGAVSTEAEIYPDRKGIKQLWPVPVPQIRFKFEDGEYNAYQKLSSGVTGELIPLNPITYQFLCAEFWKDGEPYAKPPMTAAIDGILRGDNLLTNIDYIIAKLGLLGIRDISFTAAPPDAGDIEGSPSHYAKNEKRLTAILASEKEHERDGVRVHTDDIIYGLTQAIADTRGLDGVYKLNEEQISAGTGIAEALYGRSRQTTEAFATVMFALASAIAETAQRLSATHIAYFINLELALNGLNERVKVTNKPIVSLDPKNDADAEYRRIEVIGLKEALGYIDHTQAGNEAGYEDVPELPEKPNPVDEEPVEEEPAEESQESISLVFPIPNRGAALRPLSPEARRLLRAFDNAVDAAALDAGEYSMATLEEFMASHSASDFANAEDFAAQLMVGIGTSWASAGPEFTAAINDTVPALYEYFILSDASVWSSGVAPIDFSFGQGSQNLVNFAKRFEPQLCTTLWSDPSRMENGSLSRFLQNEFLDRGNDIFRRTNPQSYATFRDAFGRDLGHLSDYQIRRIQDTFTMRCRNGSMLEQMHQAGAKTAKISTTVTCCEICEPYEGQEFAVEPQHEAMQEQMAMTPDGYLGFLRSGSETIRSGVEDGNRAWIDMQASGLCLPPYHPGCMHDIIEP